MASKALVKKLSGRKKRSFADTAPSLSSVLEELNALKHHHDNK